MTNSGCSGGKPLRRRLFGRGLLVVIAMWITPVVAEKQLEQKTILIKGNQELPRTLYIAPWKRIGTPLGGRVLDGDLTEDYEPLERDLFQIGLELRRQGYSTDTSSLLHTATEPAED
jgi:hypothetical protein